jgi:hypothetical protein
VHQTTAGRPLAGQALDRTPEDAQWIDLIANHFRPSGRRVTDVCFPDQAILRAFRRRPVVESHMAGSRSVLLGALSVTVALVASACTSPSPQAPWTTGVAYDTARAPNSRGLLDRRGLIHSHSIYSHDACDNCPRLLPDGTCPPKDYSGPEDILVPNKQCFNDFRDGLCAVKHDFDFLTDHQGLFADTEYPNTLLYKADRGDKLITRDGNPVASEAACPNGHTTLIMAGSECGGDPSSFLPVGIESHVAKELRPTTYGVDPNPETTAALRAKGAVLLTAHTEEWSVERLTDQTTQLDGFEMYNLHANLAFTSHGTTAALNLIGRLLSNDTTMATPNLIFLSIFSEDPRYLNTWGSVLAKGVHRTTTMGTDCHRNAFPQVMADGERADSYRRMMSWFSNHILVKPNADGGFDDVGLKTGLKKGRVYGAFEVYGYPVGFDYHAEVGSSIFEMGDEVDHTSGATLKVKMPAVQQLNPKRTPPTLTARILKAIDGGWQEVATGSGDLSFKPTEAGAYRSEIRIVPLHLREDLNGDADTLLAQDYVWIYSNPIYVK